MRILLLLLFTTTLNSQTYNTVFDLLGSNGHKPGEMVITGGYHQVGDGGGATFVISGDTIPNVPVDTAATVPLDSGLYANMVVAPDDYLNITAFGASPGGAADHMAIRKATRLFWASNAMGILLVDGTNFAPNNVNFSRPYWVNPAKPLKIYGEGTINCSTRWRIWQGHTYIKGINNSTNLSVQFHQDNEKVFRINFPSNDAGFYVEGVGSPVQLENIYIQGAYTGVEIRECANTFIINCAFQSYQPTFAHVAVYNSFWVRLERVSSIVLPNNVVGNNPGYAFYLSSELQEQYLGLVEMFECDVAGGTTRIVGNHNKLAGQLNIRNFQHEGLWTNRYAFDISGQVSSIDMYNVTIADVWNGRLLPGTCRVRGNHVGTIREYQSEIRWDTENGGIPDNSIRFKTYPSWFYHINDVPNLRSPNDFSLEHGALYFRDANENKHFRPIRKFGWTVPLKKIVSTGKVIVTPSQADPLGGYNAYKFEGSELDYPLHEGSITLTDVGTNNAWWQKGDILVVGGWYKPKDEKNQTGQNFDLMAFARIDAHSNGDIKWITRNNSIWNKSYYVFTDPKTTLLGNGWTHIRDFVIYDGDEPINYHKISLTHQNRFGRDNYVFRPYVIRLRRDDFQNIHDIVNYVNSATFQAYPRNQYIKRGDLILPETSRFFAGKELLVDSNLVANGLILNKEDGKAMMINKQLVTIATSSGTDNYTIGDGGYISITHNLGKEVDNWRLSVKGEVPYTVQLVSSTSTTMLVKVFDACGHEVETGQLIISWFVE